MVGAGRRRDGKGPGVKGCLEPRLTPAPRSVPGWPGSCGWSGGRLCRWPQSLREAAATFPRGRASPASPLAGKQLPSRPDGGSARPSGKGTRLPAQAPSWERPRPGPSGAGPGCGFADRTQPRRGAGQGGSGACCVGSSGPRSPALLPIRRHRPARSLRPFQPPPARRGKVPVPAPAAQHGTAAAPGPLAAARPMEATALFQVRSQAGLREG